MNVLGQPLCPVTRHPGTAVWAVRHHARGLADLRAPSVVNAIQQIASIISRRGVREEERSC
jgi:hypothetical protein